VYRVGRDGPDLYKKTIDCLVQYASTQFMNSSDVLLWRVCRSWRACDAWELYRESQASVPLQLVLKGNSHMLSTVLKAMWQWGGESNQGSATLQGNVQETGLYGPYAYK